MTISDSRDMWCAMWSWLSSLGVDVEHLKANVHMFDNVDDPDFRATLDAFSWTSADTIARNRGWEIPPFHILNGRWLDVKLNGEWKLHLKYYNGERL